MVIAVDLAAPRIVVAVTTHEANGPAPLSAGPSTELTTVSLVFEDLAKATLSPGDPGDRFVCPHVLAACTNYGATPSVDLLAT